MAHSSSYSRSSRSQRAYQRLNEYQKSWWQESGSIQILSISSLRQETQEVFFSHLAGRVVHISILWDKKVRQLFFSSAVSCRAQDEGPAYELLIVQDSRHQEAVQAFQPLYHYD